jgi:uncharacterized protein
MFIQTKEIGRDGLTIDRRFEYDMPAPPGGVEAVSVGEVHVTGTLNRTGAGIDFRGDIDTIATTACSRCLEPYQLPLALHFRLLYTPESDAQSRGERRIDDESITHAHYDGAGISLGELLEEQVYLALPLKPLCRTDCKGLCACCGMNLNVEACECSENQDGTRTEDPRLLTLKTLL